jgi:hypothetical protein
MFRVSLLTLTLTVAGFAQTIPGTFTTSQPLPNSGQPLVTTPTLTLSNGFSPATVNSQQTLPSEQPETMASDMPQSEGGYVNMATVATPEPSTPNFNFGSTEGQTAFNFGMAGPGLGAIAREFKSGRVQAHKTYTNDDIDRLTSEAPENGIIYAKTGNGQPITDRNQSGFSPLSGIANMPEVTSNPDRTELANGRDADQGQDSASASNVEQGQSAGQRATTPSMDATRPANNNDTQQLPASDNPR